LATQVGPLAVAVLAAILLIALALDLKLSGASPLLSFTSASLACAALYAALRRPVLATAVQIVGIGTAGIGLHQSVVPGAAQVEQVTPITIAVLAVHVGVVALHHRWQVAVGVWWALTSALVLIAVLSERVSGPDAATPLALGACAWLVVLLIGAAAQQREGIRAELLAARRDVASEHAQRMLTEERSRIARELHDVVAHGMSTIHMQATSAPYRINDLDTGTRAEFAAISALAQTAMGEMRQILGLLRTGDDDERAPVPDLTRLDELIEISVRSGVTVVSTTDRDVVDVPAVVSTTAYRIVQEALSNVTRHADGSRATVTLARDQQELLVTVVNTAGRATTPEDPDRSRYGLIGMRERVVHLGGTLDHGIEPDGGFRVCARLPLLWTRSDPPSFQESD
jgi:signal transduction histidine kinase